ncbi:4'-phosphopantetheinyl transferase family protein [Vibrio owensii]|uniref:4'-phosphopantetheinyl transferase family protein n=1 Tax=Vibrio owensii TaxID=696485 RepID=UPI003140734A
MKATADMYCQNGFPEEEKLIQKAVTKRQQEFRAGRHAARSAIKKLIPSTSNDANVTILSGNTREPLFPATISGSISHTDNICLAACALKSNIASLGIDIEANKPLASHLFATVYTRDEQQLLASTSNIPDTLIFSIKESLFKCCYPFVQMYFDFLDAQITLEPATEYSGQFRFELIGRNQAALREKLPNLGFHGYYSFDQQYVFSLCYFS